MIIRDFKFIPYKLKLKSPFKNASFTINNREGFIVRIEDENNFVGFGEVAPLPGFSVEAIEKCDIALNKLHYSIIEKSSKKIDFDLIQELRSISDLPSLSFGIEQATGVFSTNPIIPDPEVAATFVLQMFALGFQTTPTLSQNHPARNLPGRELVHMAHVYLTSNTASENIDIGGLTDE